MIQFDSKHNVHHYQWFPYRRIPSFILPPPYRSWVTSQGSLTKRLIQASHGDFKVRLVSNRLQLPEFDERRLLNLSSRQVGLVREVELLCQGSIWVKARSVIPLHTLQGPERRIAHLGEKPLGAYLFSARHMRRGPLEIGREKGSKGDNRRRWARRSVFYLQQKPLLVSEYFEPALFADASDCR